MASYKIRVIESGVEKLRNSASETFDFVSIKVGASGLEIKETTGNFDFSNKKLTNIAAGTAAGEALSYSQVGAANGVAGLDGGGKVPIAQLPNSIMEFQGTWNASTNTPTLADATGNTGDVYRVNVAGTQNLGSGSQTFAVGDWVMYDAGGVWRLAHAGGDQVNSVFGRAGVVTAQSGDYNASQITNTPAGNISSTDVQAAINELDTEKLASAAFTDTAVTGKLITGFSSGAGTVAGTDTILQAINKLDGNIGALSAGSSATVSLQNDNGSAITVRQIVYVKSNGHVDLAQANSANSASMLAVVYDSSIASSTSGLVTVKTGGTIGGFSSLTPGAAIFLSDSSAGAITQTAPTATNSYYVKLGYALSATTILWDPSSAILIAS